MDTASFFARVLPRGGIKILAELVPYKDKKTGAQLEGWRYTTYQAFDAMAQAAAQFDAQKRTIYHACNGYGDWYHDAALDKKRIRTATNATTCRALYDDIDVGKLDEEGNLKPNCYATVSEAMTAIRAFIKATAIPAPLVVYSGAGVHLYWPLTEDVSPEQWKELSLAKRRLTTHFQLKCDRAVDMDLARVLRPVGTTNRKHGATVTAKNDPRDTTPEAMASALEAAIVTHNAPTVKSGNPKAAKNPRNPFAAALENDFPVSYASRVADYCASVRWFRDTGAPDEPAWFVLTGAVKHCADGAERIHEWSQQYDGYDQHETDTKIVNWMYGPATCESIKTITPKQCAGCTQKCSAPIQLGVIAETKPPEIETVVTAPPPVEMTTAELLKKIWPAHFAIRDGKMTKAVTLEDGSIEYVTFCDTVFYPVGLAKGEEGEWQAEIEYIALHGDKRRFLVNTSDISSADKLAGALAAHTVWVYGKGGSMLAKEAMRQMCLSLQHQRKEVETVQAFGWTDDMSGFIIGNKKIGEDGKVSDVLMSEGIRSAGMAKDFGVEGDRASWVSLVNEIYNRPGAEPFQFAFLISAASPLISLAGIKGFHGIPVAYTGKGGRGKSTTHMVAASMWGDGAKFLHSANKAGSTMNALTARVGIARHLPWVMDELTGQTKEDLADMFYALSNGRAKDRLLGNGVFATGSKTWDMFTLVNGNVDIGSLMSSLDDSNVAEAVSVRCMEIKIDDDLNERVFGDLDVKNMIDGQLQNHYGHVGRELISFYLKKRGAIVKRIMDVRKEFSPTTADETRERFYYDTIAFALVAGAVMKKLGIIQFDLEAIKKWAVNIVKTLRSHRKEHKLSNDDVVGQFISSLHDKTLVTKHLADGRAKSIEIPIVVPRVSIEARHASETRRLIVSAKALRDWCKDNGYVVSYVREIMNNEGYILHSHGKDKAGGFNFRLGGGTNSISGVARCFELDYVKVFGNTAAAEVVPLQRLKVAT